LTRPFTAIGFPDGRIGCSAPDALPAVAEVEDVLRVRAAVPVDPRADGEARAACDARGQEEMTKRYTHATDERNRKAGKAVTIWPQKQKRQAG